MKQFVLFIYCLIVMYNCGVAQINSQCNTPRPGDKPQWALSHEYIAVTNNDSLLHDFSAMRFIKSGETRYSLFRDSLLLKKEMRQISVYKLHNDTLLLTAERKPGLNMSYILPEVVMTYPFNEQSDISGYYYAEGRDGAGHYVSDAGIYISSISGIGQIITPDCDTIGDVVQLSYRRVGTTHVFDDFNSSFGNTNDSTLIDTQNIEKRLATDSISHQISRNVWYAPGYRYPIVESRQYVLMYYNTPVDTSMVTFYFPPQSQEFDLETDAVNELLRQEIKNMTYQSVTPKSRNINEIRAIPDNGASDEQTMSLHANVDCNLYPTVVNGKITAHISTDDRATINMSLLNSSGALLWEHDNDIEAGQYKIDCDMSNYISGNYVMIITINNEKFSYKLIKP